jgi:hypothetical protein
MVVRRVVAFVSLVIACHHEPVVVEARLPSVPSASAAPRAPAPSPVTYDAFTSTDENEFVGWQILLARRDDSVRVLVRSRGTAALPVELAGTTRPEGARLRVRASAGPSEKAVRFDGWIDGEMLRGVLRTDTAREDVTAKRGVPAMSNDVDIGIGATIADHRFQVGWQQHGQNVKATIADPSGSRTLEGTMRDGKFKLAGEGVSMRGVLSNLIAGLGEWSEAGETRPLTLDVMHVATPKPRALGSGVRVVTADRWVGGVAGCPSSYDVYPEVTGVGGTNELSLNRLLHPGAPPVRCEGESELAFLGAAWSTSTYVFTASRPDWFAIRRTLYGYMGGAHGTWGETCDVASLATGKVGSLQSELSAASLSKLGPIVRKAILAAAPGKSLVDLGFNADNPDVTKDRVMCAVDDHDKLALEVVYQSDMDPAGNFRFTEVRPRIPASTARTLFPAGSLGALVFQ